MVFSVTDYRFQCVKLGLKEKPEKYYTDPSLILTFRFPHLTTKSPPPIMSGGLEVTPLYGSFAASPNSPSPPPLCTLIRFANTTILIDIGWAPPFDPAMLTNLKAVAAEVDAVLLTGGGIQHVAALPYAKEKFGLQARVYCTPPAYKMGQVALYDLFGNQSHDGLAARLGFTFTSLDNYFSLLGTNPPFMTLKYSQSLTVNRKGRPVLTCAPHRSGSTVGGSYWVLERLLDNTKVCFVNGWNREKERHLNGVDVVQYGSGVDCLIWRVGAGRGHAVRELMLSEDPPELPSSMQKRESALVSCVMGALRAGGNVLIPVDASARVLELLLVLNSFWTEKRHGESYKLCWCGSMAQNTKEFSRSMLEWMADPLGRQFDTQMRHPFALRCVAVEERRSDE